MSIAPSDDVLCEYLKHQKSQEEEEQEQKTSRKDKRLHGV